jgi:hypothetical protein
VYLCIYWTRNELIDASLCEDLFHFQEQQPDGDRSAISFSEVLKVKWITLATVARRCVHAVVF